MREFLTERGGFTHCVSEFLRISQDVPPAKVYREHVPELLRAATSLGGAARTRSGCPVQVQLLGGDAEKLAIAAARAIELGAAGVDLNFGCPAPTVNRHDGGATLLKHPERIRAIVSAVRAAVPKHHPVSAKLRLGWDSLDPIHLNADMAAEGGADWITIHGRTRMAGYQPPAYWGPIGEVRLRLAIPVIANGDIWTMEDFLRCRDETKCDHFMIGRSALADPWLARRIARELKILSGAVCNQNLDSEGVRSFTTDASAWRPLIKRFSEISLNYDVSSHKRVLSRVKQWIRLAHNRTSIDWFDALKRSESYDQIFDVVI